MFNNHGHIKMINQKKEVFLQTLTVKIHCFNWMVYLLGKMEEHSQILNLKINNLAGIAIKYIKVILIVKYFNMAIR